MTATDSIDRTTAIVAWADFLDRTRGPSMTYVISSGLFLPLLAPDPPEDSDPDCQKQPKRATKSPSPE